MYYVFVIKFCDNEMLLVQGTNKIVKLLVPHEICWFKTRGQAAISNTAKWYVAYIELCTP